MGGGFCRVESALHCINNETEFPPMKDLTQIVLVMGRVFSLTDERLTDAEGGMICWTGWGGGNGGGMCGCRPGSPQIYSSHLGAATGVRADAQ